MKTVFHCNRLVKDEDTKVEEILRACFFLDDVMQWETGGADLFERTKQTTHVDVRSGHALYIDVPFVKFNQIMTDFLDRQGDIIIQMKQN